MSHHVASHFASLTFIIKIEMGMRRVLVGLENAFAHLVPDATDSY